MPNQEPIPTRPLNPADLQAFMAQRGVVGELLYLDVPTPTVESAASAVGAHPDQIVKSILFLVKERPILTIACGTTRVDQRAVATHSQVGRKQVRLASPEVVQAVSGFAVGAMPPFGHRQPLTTLMDPAVLEQPVVYAGGGAENALARLLPQDILRVTRAVIVPLQAPPSP